jgi:surface antigen
MIGFNASRLGPRIAHTLACAALALLLGGCVGPYHPPGPRAQIGAFTGAAAGGLIGSAASGGGAEAIVAGVLLGGLLGGAVGDSLDRADRRYAVVSYQQGLEYHPSGRPSYWHNPASGHAGSFTPTRSWETAYGPCREYTQTVRVGGRVRGARGIACRDAYGQWRIER